jgi:hypothetical protein
MLLLLSMASNEHGPLLRHKGDQHHVPDPHHVGHLAPTQLVENVPHTVIRSGAGHVPHGDDLPLAVLLRLVPLWVGPVHLLDRHFVEQDHIARDKLPAGEGCQPGCSW